MKGRALFIGSKRSDSAQQSFSAAESGRWMSGWIFCEHNIPMVDILLRAKPIERCWRIFTKYRAFPTENEKPFRQSWSAPTCHSPKMKCSNDYQPGKTQQSRKVPLFN